MKTGLLKNVRLSQTYNSSHNLSATVDTLFTWYSRKRCLKQHIEELIDDLKTVSKTTADQITTHISIISPSPTVS